MDERIINPSHYKNSDGTDKIDTIRETLTKEEFKGYLKGSAMKYELRAGEKKHIDVPMAVDFLGKLPKGNVAMLKDDVVRLFTEWQTEVNARMIKNDKGKAGWFIDKIASLYKEAWRGITITKITQEADTEAVK